MKYRKKKRGHLKKTSGAGKTRLNGEVKNLRKTALVLWQELQMLESFYCLEIKRQVNFFEEIRRFEIALIKRALLQTGGRQNESARLLGVSTSNLNNKIKRFGIPNRVSALTPINKLM